MKNQGGRGHIGILNASGQNVACLVKNVIVCLNKPILNTDVTSTPWPPYAQYYSD